MDQHTAESRFASCSQRWDAARSFRRYRTHQQDQKTRRNQAKANVLTGIAETLLMAATLAAGIAMYELMANTPELLAVTAAIVTAFGAQSVLAPMFTTVFGPTIDRLRSLETKGADQS